MPAPKGIPFTREELMTALDYAPDTGQFRWKISPAASVPAGSLAGHSATSGELRVMYKRWALQCHRLAWLIIHGVWPAGHVRHINGDSTDNRIANLETAMPARARNDIDVDRFRQDFHYDPETGEMRRLRVVHGNAKAGVVPKSDNGLGYMTLSYLGKQHTIHRLAWLYVHGEWPEHYIDHINGNPSDNRIANLRLATPAQNTANAGARKNNKTGYRGVTFKPATGKFMAQIMAHSHLYKLGYFDTAYAAHLAYCAAAKIHHGEFAQDPLPPPDEKE